MKMNIDVPDFDKETGIAYKWEHGFEIGTRVQHGAITITANREGLISLANHLLNLAQENVPSGHHLRFDEHNSLQDGSLELVIAKI